jgi:transposase
MYVCILDKKGEILYRRNMPTDPKRLLRAIKPYREDIVISVECMFCWYWLADLCAQEGIPFVLGHALYMKAIHGGKAKNDRIDAHKIAVLLRGGMIPIAYVYPSVMRATRDLLRRRNHFMRKRAELLAHVQNTVSFRCACTFSTTITVGKSALTECVRYAARQASGVLGA